MTGPRWRKDAGIEEKPPRIVEQPSSRGRVFEGDPEAEARYLKLLRGGSVAVHAPTASAKFEKFGTKVMKAR